MLGIGMALSLYKTAGGALGPAVAVTITGIALIGGFSSMVGSTD